MNSDSDLTRLHVFLARAGIASRRACEKLILEGRVQVNGEKITTLGTKVTDKDLILFDGQAVSVVAKKISIAIHKPIQMLCSNKDDQGRLLVSDLFMNSISERLFHAGRLDFMSSGLIIYTNDGELAKKITHPSFQVKKEYEVIAFQDIPDEMLFAYKEGIVIDGELLKLYSFERKSANTVHLVLTQGKNREIRRVFEKNEIVIRSLCRIRIGTVSLENIKSEQFRYLTEAEIQWFLKRVPQKPK